MEILQNDLFITSSRLRFYSVEVLEPLNKSIAFALCRQIFKYE